MVLVLIYYNLFYEYYLENFKMKNNYEKKINEIFANIEDINKKNYFFILFLLFKCLLNTY